MSDGCCAVNMTRMLTYIINLVESEFPLRASRATQLSSHLRRFERWQLHRIQSVYVLLRCRDQNFARSNVSSSARQRNPPPALLPRYPRTSEDVSEPRTLNVDDGHRYVFPLNVQSHETSTTVPGTRRQTSTIQGDPSTAMMNCPSPGRWPSEHEAEQRPAGSASSDPPAQRASRLEVCNCSRLLQVLRSSL